MIHAQYFQQIIKYIVFNKETNKWEHYRPQYED